MEIEIENCSNYFIEKPNKSVFLDDLNNHILQDSIETGEEEIKTVDDSTISSKSTELEENSENLVYDDSNKENFKKDQNKEDELSHIDSQDITIDKYDLKYIKNYVDSFNTSPTIHKDSSALDILSSYLKGQKVLYLESRDLYKSYLNFGGFLLVLV